MGLIRNDLGWVLIFIAFSSLLSVVFARWLDKRSINIGPWRFLGAGSLPTLLIFVMLAIGHIMWLQHQPDEHDPYSPLMFLMFGFPFVLLNLMANIGAVFVFGRKR